MCLIIHKPAQTEIADSIIRSALDYNPDGFGIMSAGKAEKYSAMGFSEAKRIIGEYRDVECAIHFRMATHGKVNKSNTHPFRLKNRAYLMHNGVLGKYTKLVDAKGTKSDTRLFVETFCNRMISEHGSIPVAELESEITGSAVCIMQPDGTINRYGRGWNQYAGSWFSNTYAWDHPEYTTTWDSYGTSDYASEYWKQYYDGEESEECEVIDFADRSSYKLESKDDSCGAELLRRLDPWADELPLNNLDFVAYDDADIHDALMAGYIDASEFLALCSADTLCNLYGYAAAHNMVSY